MTRVGVALSGGGHRASVWAAGLLLYLADAGRNGDVGVIASVSGGSITNGVVAQEMDYRQARADQVRDGLGPLLHHIAYTGLFFWGPSTNRYVITVLGVLGLGLLGFLAGLVMAFITGIGVAAGMVLVASLIVLAAGVVIFARRSAVVDRALARTHFTRQGRPTGLASVARSLDHVFCATELQAGEHFYLSPRFLYSYRFGCGEPGGLALSTAVQASACLPGAFAARRLDTAPHRFRRSAEVTEPPEVPGQMLLTDGGVYDNMADQWAAGLAARVRDNAALDIRTTGLDELVVANASAGPPWTTVKANWLPIRNELSTLGRVKDVQYAVSTSTRRHDLVNAWETAARAGHGVIGALVQIAQSPFEVPDAFAQDDRLPDRAARARAAIAWLGGSDANRAAWAAVAEESRTLPTVLRKLVPHAMAEANAYYADDVRAVLFGYMPARVRRATRNGPGLRIARSGRLDPDAIYTCLSHDVIAHETTHAVLDGLRPRFLMPGLPDQPAFHEGLADIVALLSVFSMPEVVRSLLGQADLEGRIADRSVSDQDLKRNALFTLAEQVGSALKDERGSALRDSITLRPSTRWASNPRYNEPHFRGEILVWIILETLAGIWRKRLEDISFAGSVSLARAAEEGATAAQHLLGMCVRGDRLPPAGRVRVPGLPGGPAGLRRRDRPGRQARATGSPSATRSPGGASRTRTITSPTCRSPASPPSTATSATRRCAATPTRSSGSSGKTSNSSRSTRASISTSSTSARPSGSAPTASWSRRR